MQLSSLPFKLDSTIATKATGLIFLSVSGLDETTSEIRLNVTPTQAKLQNSQTRHQPASIAKCSFKKYVSVSLIFYQLSAYNQDPLDFLFCLDLFCIFCFGILVFCLIFDNASCSPVHFQSQYDLSAQVSPSYWDEKFVEPLLVYVVLVWIPGLCAYWASILSTELQL